MMKDLYETPEMEIVRFTFAEMLANDKLNPSGDEEFKDDGGDVSGEDW